MKSSLKTTDVCSVPALGLGTWKLRGEECKKIVRKALDIGYRHVDTARFYGNERAVGEAITDFPRDELFLTTKIWKDKLRYEDFKQSAEESLRQLGTDYVDLLLIHWPNPEIPLEQTVKAMNELVKEGKARHIGVSNFDRSQLGRAIELSDQPIANNQVKYHLGKDMSPTLDYCRKNDVLLTAYSPLGQGKVPKLESLKEIAANYDKTPGQVALKWLIDQDNVLAIPKASSEGHLKQNIRLFDWNLDGADVKKLDQLRIEA